MAPLESNERDALLRGILDSALDAVVGMDSGGRILEFNRAAEQMFGFTRGEAIGRPLVELIVPNDLRDAHRAGLRRYLESGEALVLGKPVVLKAMRKGGQEFPIEAAITPLDLEGPPRFVGFVRDISERRRAESEKNKLEAKVYQTRRLESLGILAGGVAHDFNNLLVGMLGHADLALDELSPLSSAAESVKKIEQAARRAADLCQQLLSYAGRGRFVIEEMELNPVILGMGGLLTASVSKKVTLEYHLGRDLPHIQGDATQIRQVLTNLITNASEATGGRGGTISISTSAVTCDDAYLRTALVGEHAAEGRYVALDISDTGCGISADILENLFDPFFTTRFAGRGRGLGLAVVRGILLGHRGAIQVHSELERGTTFRVLFPSTNRSEIPRIPTTPPSGGLSAPVPS